MSEDTRVVLCDFSGKPVYWDTVVEPAAKDLTLAVFVIDLANRASMEWVRATAARMRTSRTAKFTKTLLIGNKADIMLRTVTNEEAQDLAKEMGATFVTVSMKDPEAVVRAFDELVGVTASVPKR